MTIALVSSVSAGSADSNGFTTGTVDTTGANFLVACVAIYSGGSGSLSDSKSNTWTPLTQYVSGFGTIGFVQFFYSENPTVGSGHTFTISGSGTFPALCVAAFSGGATSSSFDVQNGTAGTFNSTLACGNVTPSVANELLVGGYGSAGNPASIDSGFTVAQSVPFAPGACIGVSLAYLIETTATAQNPTWTSGAADILVANIATFKAEAAGVVLQGAQQRFFM